MVILHICAVFLFMEGHKNEILFSFIRLLSRHLFVDGYIWIVFIVPSKAFVSYYYHEIIRVFNLTNIKKKKRESKFFRLP